MVSMHRYFDTVCPGSSVSFYIVSYYIKWVTTSLTYYSIYITCLALTTCTLINHE